MLARMWEKEPAYTVGGNINWFSHYENSIKPKIDSPYDSTIPLLGIYLKEYKQKRYLHTHVYCSSLQTVESAEVPNN
jgi:hypothetical protein